MTSFFVRTIFTGFAALTVTLAIAEDAPRADPLTLDAKTIADAGIVIDVAAPRALARKKTPSGPNSSASFRIGLIAGLSAGW